MPDTKIEAGRWHFGKALWPSIRNPQFSTLAVPVAIPAPGENLAESGANVNTYIALYWTQAATPSAIAKATADRPATLSPSDGEREG